MGKPRMIVVIRHAQSEGNQNRQIHQTIPDHRVKLTSEGWNQAQEAGKRLRAMLRPTDTLQFYTSPYKRTRETTQGILDTLTADTPDASPFSRDSIKVWEEPRLREQDFGNFQPCSDAMERMWQERADYGHFFYRIPNGESAADAYDRVSGFNESLWRSFGEDDFPSVCVLVTHGLMTRVFLMKWYHWSVEYFEDLRNVNHCEFVLMNKSPDSGKYILENQLRTWSEYKRRMAKERGEPEPQPLVSPPIRKRWGGCPEGCDHAHDDYPRRKRRDTKHDSISRTSLDATADKNKESTSSAANLTDRSLEGSQVKASQNQETKLAEEDDEAFPHVKTDHSSGSNSPRRLQMSSQTAAEFSQRIKNAQKSHSIPTYLEAGRDFGGTDSGAPTPSYAGDNQPPLSIKEVAQTHSTNNNDKASKEWLTDTKRRSSDSELERKWVQESGMGTGARADALGDQEDSDERDSLEGRTLPEIEELERHDKSLRGSVY